MLVIEQLFAGHSHSHGPSLPLGVIDQSTEIQFDVDLNEQEQGVASSSGFKQVDHLPQTPIVADSRQSAFPLTLGLVLHGLADGFALGISTLSIPGSDSSALSFVVFFALLVHKGVQLYFLYALLLITQTKHQLHWR
jgi:zinc transporter 9